MSQSGTHWLSLAVLTAVLVLVFALSQLGYLQPVQGTVRTVLSPVQAVMTNLAARAGKSAFSIRDLPDLRQRASDMQTEVNRLQVENALLAELQRENENLRQLLNFTRNNPWYDYRAAAVVGHRFGGDTSNLLFSIFIDVGARDGVAKGMPVVTDRGLVGRVTAVGPTVAEVLLIIDPGSAVNGRVVNSRATGLVRGNIDGGLLMERIPQGETISPGDIVLTSGLGGNIPDKLVIGQMTEVFHRDLDMFQSARIRPTVDFGKLETVLVITTFKSRSFDEPLGPADGEENTD